MVWVWVLGALAVAVVVHLVLYSRRRHKLILAFAARRGLTCRPGGDPDRTQPLEEAFDFEEPGIKRTLGCIRDAVACGEIVLFRATELLDLETHGSSEHAHRGRIAVSFPVREDSDLFVLVSPGLGFASRHPRRSDFATDPCYPALQETLAGDPPPHPLSVTLTRGRALLYLEPLATGGEKSPDVDYLFRIGKALHAALRESVEHAVAH